MFMGLNQSRGGQAKFLRGGGGLAKITFLEIKVLLVRFFSKFKLANTGKSEKTLFIAFLLPNIWYIRPKAGKFFCFSSKSLPKCSFSLIFIG